MIIKWLFKQFTRLQIFLYRRSGGKTFGRVRGMPVLLLTTVGRKTGLQRVTPVMYMQDGDYYVITASNSGADKHPDWFVNLRAHPQARIEVGNLTRRVMAHPASPEEKGRLWPRLVGQAPFFEGYRQRTSRDIPMVILQSTSELPTFSDQESKS
jgi:deazaflavin-dependent oxidoreductase (nitroreductase family)